jgi:hypothetical protein
MNARRRAPQPPAGLPTHPIAFRDGIPVLAAVESSSGLQWHVWCCWCRRKHFHGALPGHRSAHCDQRTSGYWLSGYFIELIPAA